MARTKTKPYEGEVLDGQTFEASQVDEVLERLVPGDEVSFWDISESALREKAHAVARKRFGADGGDMTTGFKREERYGASTQLVGDQKRTEARIKFLADKRAKAVKARANVQLALMRASRREYRAPRPSTLADQLRSLAPGQVLEVNTTEHGSVPSVRVMASLIGKELGVRFKVSARVTVSRPDDTLPPPQGSQSIEDPEDEEARF